MTNYNQLTNNPSNMHIHIGGGKMLLISNSIFFTVFRSEVFDPQLIHVFLSSLALSLLLLLHTPTKSIGMVFGSVCLFVCLSAA